MLHRPVISDKEKTTLIALMAIGAVGLGAGLFVNTERAWASFLQNAVFFLTLTVGAMVFVSIHHVSNAGWSASLRRIPEAMATYLPVGALAILLVFFGRHSIYGWSRGIVPAGEAMKMKTAFLNTPFFFLRMAAILG